MPLTQSLTDRLRANGPIMQIFLATLKGEANELSMDDLRAHHRQGMQAMPTVDGVAFEMVDMDGVSGLRAVPRDAVAGRTLLYSHGGGYIVGDPDGYRGFVSAIADRAKSTVLVPNYRLAPEHPFPAPMQDVLSAYRWALGAGARAHQFAFLGDSAGGALTVSVMAMARDEGLPLPVAGVAMSPWVNLEHTGASIESRAERDLVHTGVPDALHVMGSVFLNGAPPRSPEASPVFAELHGLPPILIQVGEAEQLLSDSLQLSERLAQAGVRTTIEIWPDMFHGWQMFHAELDEAEEALSNAIDFLNREFERAAQRAA